MSNSSETLFDRVGGSDAVGAMVDQFYARVLADPDLRPYFANASVERLKRMQKEFFAAALDGPMATGDADLVKIHQGLGITRRQVTQFVNHLISVLDEQHAIDRRDAMDIVYRIATFSDQVIGDCGGVDG